MKSSLTSNEEHGRTLHFTRHFKRLNDLLEMKKTEYINPEMEIVKMQLQGMIAASAQTEDNTPNIPGELDDDDNP